MKSYFVTEGSIVRKIWGKSDTILFIFAGAAAEFALNKAVDWLYFTGRLPTDPLGRLFSTVSYARRIVFAEKAPAEEAIRIISQIHTGVEKARGAQIPDWAYRDVLFMLIHYSIASFELLERPLQASEKEEVYDVFYRMGTLMQLSHLPPTYADWLPVRAAHLTADMALSDYTLDLYRQYRKHLGAFRYGVLKEAQWLVVPPLVRQMLKLGRFSYVQPLVPLYKLLRVLRLDALLKALLLPGQYKKEIAALDTPPLHKGERSL